MLIFVSTKKLQKICNSSKEMQRSFGLQLADEKSALVKFNRWEGESSGKFTFVPSGPAGSLRISLRRYRAWGSLGFDFYWGKSRHNPKYWRVRRTTNAKKFRGGLAALTDWLKKSRSLPLPEIVARFKSKLQGVWNYYGVIGNSERLWAYAWNAKRLVLSWLSRRSQRRSYNWTTFEEAWNRWKIPPPQIFEQPWPQTRQNHPQPVKNVQPIRVQS